MVVGYCTVRRPSPRPPIQRIVFGGSFEVDGFAGACSNATSFLEYLWVVPGCAIGSAIVVDLAVGRYF